MLQSPILSTQMTLIHLLSDFKAAARSSWGNILEHSRFLSLSSYGHQSFSSIHITVLNFIDFMPSSNFDEAFEAAKSYALAPVLTVHRKSNTSPILQKSMWPRKLPSCTFSQMPADSSQGRQFVPDLAAEDDDAFEAAQTFTLPSVCMAGKQG